MKWEYKLIPVIKDRSDEMVENMLNIWGDDGWELVGMYDQGASRIFVMKRPEASEA